MTDWIPGDVKITTKRSTTHWSRRACRHVAPLAYIGCFGQVLLAEQGKELEDVANFEAGAFSWSHSEDSYRCIRQYPLISTGDLCEWSQRKVGRSSCFSSEENPLGYSDTRQEWMEASASHWSFSRINEIVGRTDHADLHSTTFCNIVALKSSVTRMHTEVDVF